MGDTPDLTVNVGGLRVQIGRQLGRGDVAGYVMYEGGRETPMDVLVIALAGPVANLLVAAGTATAAVQVWASQPMLSLILWGTTLGGLMMGVGNLVPGGASMETFSDGRWAGIAWRVMRNPGPRAPIWQDPRAATSVAPPPAPVAPGAP